MTKFRDPAGAMWLQALKMLEQADQLHRRFFQLGKPAAQGPVWEPPADILETGRYLQILIALPGVDASDITVSIENNRIHVIGARQASLPANTIIRRLEIPYGRFEKKIDLPDGHFQLLENVVKNGCLRLTLNKLG